MHRSRTNVAPTTAMVLTLVTMLAVAVGCTPGPSPSPPYLVKNGSGPAAHSSAAPKPSSPAWDAPADSTMSWSDCGVATTTLFQLPALPAGVSLQCASFGVPSSSDATSQQIEISVIRAMTDKTPKDAPPLVEVGGTSLVSERALATLAATGPTDILDTHPIVAVSRRGTGEGTPVLCLRADEKVAFRDGGIAPGQSFADRVAAVADASTGASDSCSDVLGPAQTSFTAAAAAGDLETLRTTWNVPALALISIGDGSNVALAYAAQHPKNVARLILDSPISYGNDLSISTEDALKSRQGAFAAFAQQCAAVRCSLGADPAGALTAIFAKARSGNLGTISEAALASTMSAVLGFSPNRATFITSLADALSSANAGNYAQLTALSTWATNATSSDGQYIARCSDAGVKPAANQATRLAQQWEKQYPLGADAAALSMVDCTAWPSNTPVPPLTSATVPVVMLGTQLDPIVGFDSETKLSGTFASAGITTASVTWAGIGHSVLIHSQCAQTALSGYLSSLTLPSAIACPA